MSQKGHVWTAPSWQELSSRMQHWSVQPRVRPLSAAHVTAGAVSLFGLRHIFDRHISKDRLTVIGFAPKSHALAEGRFRDRAVGQERPARRTAALEPASSTIPTAAADKQYYDDDDQKSCDVHTILLRADERDLGQGNPKIKNGLPRSQRPLIEAASLGP